MSDRKPRAVILAAGISSRVGKQKLLMDFRGRALIEYAIAATQPWSPIAVVGSDVGAYLDGRPDVTLLRNDTPARGMSHSLALANRFLPSDLALIVVLGDKPLVSQTLVETICLAAADADVVYPLYDHEPGHPVWLSPQARLRIDGLPPGDTLRLLRTHPGLVQRTVETRDRGAVFDVDTIEELRNSPIGRRS
ncbi:MAG: NTP transferase domain-containing protein [Candidatus Tumulicola sp.]